MAGPKIGGPAARAAEYLKPDNRPHVNTVETVWPGAYAIARRYVAFKGDSKMRAHLLGLLKTRLIERVAESPEIPVAVGYVAEVAHDLIALADRDGLRLS